MPIEDKSITLSVRREIMRRYVDCSLLDVHVMKGVVYLRGTLRPVRGHNIDMRKEMATIEHILRSTTGVREIINECEFR